MNSPSQKGHVNAELPGSCFFWFCHIIYPRVFKIYHTLLVWVWQSEYQRKGLWGILSSIVSELKHRIVDVSGEQASKGDFNHIEVARTSSISSVDLICWVIFILHSAMANHFGGTRWSERLFC